MTGLTEGAQAFQILARHLKDAGEGGLRRELSAGIRDAAQPVLTQIRGELPGYMPDRYATTLDADLKLSVSQRIGGTATAGIQIRATAPTVTGSLSPRARRSLTGRKLKRLEAGLLTHPLFGDREHWYTQTGGMKPGFFTGPVERSAPQMRDAVLAAMRRVAGQVTRKV